MPMDNDFHFLNCHERENNYRKKVGQLAPNLLFTNYIRKTLYQYVINTINAAELWKNDICWGSGNPNGNPRQLNCRTSLSQFYHCTSTFFQPLPFVAQFIFLHKFYSLLEIHYFFVIGDFQCISLNF